MGLAVCNYGALLAERMDLAKARARYSNWLKRVGWEIQYLELVHSWGFKPCCGYFLEMLHAAAGRETG